MAGRHHEDREGGAESRREPGQDTPLTETIQGPAGERRRYRGADAERPGREARDGVRAGH